MIYVDSAGPAGRGVFATCTILPTTEIERAPAVAITAEERKAMKGMDFGEYPFVDRETYAERDEIRKRLPCPGFVAFGLSSLVNHSDCPNVRVDFEKEDGHWWAVMRATRKIGAAQQLLLEYPDVVEYDGYERWGTLEAPIDNGRKVSILDPAKGFTKIPLKTLNSIKRHEA